MVNTLLILTYVGENGAHVYMRNVITLKDLHLMAYKK